uniref:MFS domain-containing protein n=1 Tax=Panagrellus redivivus TaxID=6233 RepID=A0A7E4UTI9_PANRE
MVEEVLPPVPEGLPPDEDTVSINLDDPPIFKQHMVEPSEGSESPKTAKNLGDYLVFGWYTVFICVMHEFDVLSQAGAFTYMALAGLFPDISQCGSLNLTNIGPDASCAAIEASANVCTPHYAADSFKSMPLEFGYYCSTKSYVKLAVSFQMIGMLLGATSFGQFSDMYGRRKLLLIGSAGTSICSLLTSFTPNLMWFSVTQFCTLFFAGGVGTVHTVFLMETVPKDHRFWIHLVIGFSPNMIIFAFLAYLAGDWRWTARVISGLCIPHIILQWIGFESPRWLVQSGQLDKATEIYEKIEKYNGTASAERSKLLNELIDEERVKLAERKTAKKYYVWHTFYTKPMIGENLTMAYCLLVSAILYYGLVFNMEELVGSVYANIALLGLLRTIFGCILGALDYLWPKLGRKPICITFLIAILVALAIVIPEKLGFYTNNLVRNISMLSVTAMISQIFVIGFLVTGELFPTPIRNVATAFQQVFSRLGVVFAAQFFVIFNFNPAAPYFAMATMVIGFLILFGTFIPETKGTPLSDHMPPKSEKAWHWNSGKTAPTKDVESTL